MTERNFLGILDTLGGRNEKLRSEHFIRRLKVLPDLTPDELIQLPNVSKLTINGKIKPRSFQIFAFGMHHKAMTVSSNEGFVRAAKMQGVEIPCILHEARYLTELKEHSAKHIDD